jgi:hypothetical protein
VLGFVKDENTKRGLQGLVDSGEAQFVRREVWVLQILLSFIVDSLEALSGTCTLYLSEERTW